MDPLIPIGEMAPDFELRDGFGKRYSKAGMQGHIGVLNFWSAECDWCRRVDAELVSKLNQWDNQVVVWWIASNTNEGLGLITQTAVERRIPCVLIDADHRVADLYGAQTTPHFFIIDGEGRLRYQGAWDDITFRQRNATRNHVSEAIDALLANRDIQLPQTPAYGCTIVRISE
jgi:peroxiredoxin